jgi:hypothetical protein
LQRVGGLGGRGQVGVVLPGQAQCAQFKNFAVVVELVNALAGEQESDRTAVRAMIEQGGDEHTQR